MFLRIESLVLILKQQFSLLFHLNIIIRYIEIGSAKLLCGICFGELVNIDKGANSSTNGVYIIEKGCSFFASYSTNKISVLLSYQPFAQ